MSKKYPLIHKLAHWINERESIRLAREASKPQDKWTKDPILQTYRFCNVRREDDRVTQWIAKHWREPNRADPMIWHTMTVARFINWPPSLEVMGYPKRWNTKSVLKKLTKFNEAGNKVFTGAYIVSTNGQKVKKLPYIIDMLGSMRKEGKIITKDMTLQEAHTRLCAVPRHGTFMAGQVIADIKYTDLLSNASDWNNWAAIGPGSMRGLNRVMGLPLNNRWKNPAFSNQLIDLREKLNKRRMKMSMYDLNLQDLQNCLCETDKYLRLEAGGRTRSKYHTHADQYTV